MNATGLTHNISEVDAFLIQVDAEECRRSLKQFAISVWPIIEPTRFVDGWVIDCLCEHLEAVTRGEIRRLLINIPPRHSKSTTLVLWRVWTWLQSSSERFLAASYSLNLSIRDNVRVRRIIEDPWFQARYGREFQLAGDQNVKSFFENDQRGYQMAISVDGATTGQGGSYLVLDDPHNADEAHSDAERETALMWFREVWTNRLNDQERDKMVVVGQRIHENDVCGYILRERPDWVHLNLPAMYEPSRHCITPIWQDPRTYEGDLLWPERFSKAALDGLRRDLGSNGFAAQYQQTPVPAGGGVFKSAWLRSFGSMDKAYILHTPQGNHAVLQKDCWRFITVDLAISSKEDADFTVIQVWACTPESDLLLIDQIRSHLNNPEQQQSIKRLHYQYQPDFIEIETVAYQLALAQQLLVQGIPVKEYRPVRDKVSRASTAAIYMEQGKIYFPDTAPWLAELQYEILHFPFAEHDDQVDSLSMAADVISMPRPAGGMLVPTINEQDIGEGWF